MAARLPQAAAAVVDTLEVAVSLHPHPLRYPAEIIAHQVDNGRMLGRFLSIIEQQLPGIWLICRPCALHGKSMNCAILNADKYFRRKTDKLVAQPQSVAGMALQEDIAQTARQLHRRRHSEVDQKAVAPQQSRLYHLKSLSIMRKGYRLPLKQLYWLQRRRKIKIFKPLKIK